jgi:hypothetical protein
MACLSPVDLSIYQAILLGTGANETASIVTSKGSPNHNVLVQMADLKLATPEEFKTIGVPPAEFTMVRYALTDFCRKRLGSLMQDVLSHRALLQSQGGRI